MARAPFRFAAALAAMLVPLAAFADTPAEQAATLQQQLHDWVEKTFGPAVKIPDGLVQFAPEGDHVRVTVHLRALPVLSGVEGGDFSVSAQALPAGRWLTYDYHLDPPLKFRMDLPPNVGGGGGAPGPGPLDVSIGFGRLDGDAITDPNFAAPSVMTTRVRDYKIDVASSRLQEHVHIDAVTGHALITPAHDGRIDVIEEGAADDFGIAAKTGEPPQSVAVFVGRVEVANHILGLDHERLAEAVKKLIGFTTTALASASNPAAERPKLDQQFARDWYTMLRGIVTGWEFRESYDDLRVEVGGHVVGLSRAIVGAGVNTPDGGMTAHMTVALDGLAAPDIPPFLRGFVPRHVLVEPTLSGINLADLDALITAVTAPGAEPSMDRPEIAERVRAMFAHGGITAGVEKLEVDLGATRIGATGKVTALSPNHFVGEAEVVATGFDALVAQVQAMPRWGKKAALFLQVLGKLGRPEGKRIVWTITANNADVKLNGLDIPALIAAGKERWP